MRRSRHVLLQPEPEPRRERDEHKVLWIIGFSILAVLMTFVPIVRYILEGSFLLVVAFGLLCMLIDALR